MCNSGNSDPGYQDLETENLNSYSTSLILLFPCILDPFIDRKTPKLMILINDLICKSPVELNWSLARVMRRMQSNSILSVNHATIQLIVTKKTLKVSRSETMYIYSLNFISFVCLLFFCLTYICWIVYIFVIFCLTYIVKLYSFFTFLFTWALF